MRYPFLQETPKGVFIKLRVQPRSSSNAVEGVVGGLLKLKLTAPPVEGEANRAVVKFLSQYLGVRKNSLSIEKGLRSREKSVRVADMNIERLEEIFTDRLGR